MKVKAPVAVGDVIEIEVTGHGHNGSGVGKYHGFTVFTPLVIPGEVVQVRINQVKKTFAQAELLTVVEECNERVAPPCPIFESCGGCQLQHMAYEVQLLMKGQQVVDSFKRIGGLDHLHIEPVIGMKNPWRYRNKAQVPVGLRNGKWVAGFYEAGTHEIVDMETCLIQDPQNDHMIATIKQLAAECHIPPYNERTGEGILRHVMVRHGFKTDETMVVLVTTHNDFPGKKKWLRKIQETLPSLTSLIQNVNARKTNVILGKKNDLIAGNEVIVDQIGAVQFKISPHSFYQVNPVQTEVLYDQVRQFAELTGAETVIDAYCGIGTIGIYLAAQAKAVYGVEIVEAAVQDAIENARLNQMRHVHFTVGAAEKVMPQWVREGIKPDVIILDPPRKGCDQALLSASVSMQPDRIVYVSCNPATLARDAKFLAEAGYEIKKVQPVDMFPHTGHVECVVLFSRMEK
ncbi:23S rRNA (uracil(1939)-C(5))-methyltransferase RlmD [Hazenella sp. IB182357]|uniref:23S rRNA (Uracil(1939)-C(5))-methyltransferase RlmD n=1 Tax=Polycladospora coralii TaxID=2771432 RepID=A0A926RVU2_9BACL|nr:23S rRNA (uracil(1939)-C(5))-methyltransferase RlmD [Polycladospora coralii]MBD1370771.1 23S rRNA (uracil(1939)-C(5))-methyltransferase RlmD [Polycladospora coralii]MBS7529709.1 23S rRNA (uracil(1939)-C(5))-methyltransferase RlmD [Polycladospora coralii]